MSKVELSINHNACVLTEFTSQIQESIIKQKDQVLHMHGCSSALYLLPPGETSPERDPGKAFS